MLRLATSTHPSLHAGGAAFSRPLFTGKERDTETGLDYFGARYYGSNMGRFSSPDEPFAGQDQQDPQSWNLYSYVGNNPLSRTDPDGHDVQLCVTNGDKTTCQVMSDSAYHQLQQAQNGKDGITMPGGLFPGGAITCGDQVCGSTHYFEHGLESDDTVNFAIAGLLRSAANAGFEMLFGKATGQVVIGKMPDLKQPGAVRAGERALADDLTNLGDPKANWAQNSSKLREVMSEGKPIRDVSAGKPGSNTGFLRAERNVLQNHGWTLQGDTWYPPK